MVCEPHRAAHYMHVSYRTGFCRFNTTLQEPTSTKCAVLLAVGYLCKDCCPWMAVSIVSSLISMDASCCACTLLSTMLAAAGRLDESICTTEGLPGACRTSWWRQQRGQQGAATDRDNVSRHMPGSDIWSEGQRGQGHRWCRQRALGGWRQQCGQREEQRERQKQRYGQ